MFIFRIFWFPFRLLFGIIGSVFRIGLRLGGIPTRLSGRAVRLVGIRGWLMLVVGVAVGALLAPMAGSELRAKLQSLIGGGSDSGTTLADKVSFELAHAPRTWHLPQPTVSVQSGDVVLAGTVPDDDARDELGRVAAAIPGVARVDNRLEVEAAPAASA